MDFSTRGFWSLASRGAIAVLMGVALVTSAGRGASGLSATFGASAAAMALVALLSAYAEPSRDAFGWALMLEGVSGLGLGAVALVASHGQPWLEYVIAGFVFLVGVFEIAVAAQLRAWLESERLLAVAGALSIGCATLLAIVRAAAMVDWARIVIAGWGVTFGALLVACAFRLREHHEGRASLQPLER